MLLAVLLVAALTVRVEAERGDIVPISGPVGLLNTSLTSFSSVVVDDANQRVYIVSEQGNTIVAADFLGNQTAIRPTLAQPSAVAVGGGFAYALLSGTGQVVRLDPTTLAPTVLVGGLVDASGLAYAGGFLYVFSDLDGTQNVLRKINATTGAMTATSSLLVIGLSIRTVCISAAPRISVRDRREQLSVEPGYGRSHPQL